MDISLAWLQTQGLSKGIDRGKGGGNWVNKSRWKDLDEQLFSISLQAQCLKIRSDPQGYFSL